MGRKFYPTSFSLFKGSRHCWHSLSRKFFKLLSSTCMGYWILTEIFTEDFNPIIRDWDVEQQVKKERYFQKVRAYQRVGFNVIPQETKITGFELVKKYFENLTGDGWTFERKFRHPLVAELNKDKTLYKFNLTSAQQKIVSLIHSNNFRPTV